MLKKITQSIKADPDKYLIALLVFLLPFERIPSMDVFGITLRLNLFVAAIIIVRAIIKLVQTKHIPKLGLPAILTLVFVVWLGILVPESLNLKRGLSVFIFDTFSILTALSLAYLFKRNYFRAVIKTLLFSATIVLIFGLYQYFGNLFGLPAALTGLRESYSWEVFGFPRIQSTALEPLYFASYLLLPLSLVLVFLTSAKKAIKISTKKLMALAVAISTTIFLTVSRGGVVGMLALTVLVVGSLLALKLASWKKVLTTTGLIFLGFFTSLILIKYVNKPPLNLSLTNGKSGVNAYTSQLAKTGLEGGGDDRAKFRGKALAIWKTNTKTMLIGIGPGQFGPYIQNNIIDPSTGWAIVNNLTLEILVEAGIVGLCLFATLIIALLYAACKATYREKDVFIKLSMIALTSYLVAILIQYQTFSTLYIVHIWTAIGLLMGLTGVVNDASAMKALKPAAKTTPIKNSRKSK